MDILAKIIQALAQSKGWTEYKLSLESIYRRRLYRLGFRKNVQPSVASLQAICNACGITLSQFLQKTANFVNLRRRKNIA